MTNLSNNPDFNQFQNLADLTAKVIQSNSEVSKNKTVLGAVAQLQSAVKALTLLPESQWCDMLPVLRYALQCATPNALVQE